MYSKKKHSFLGTVTFRLTLLFVVLFALLLITVLIPIDFSLKSIMLKRLDTKIASILGDMSYYDGLKARRPDEWLGIVTDIIGWNAENAGKGNVLWILLSAEGDVIVTSKTESWENELSQIRESVPELPSRADNAVPFG